MGGGKKCSKPSAQNEKENIKCFTSDSDDEPYGDVTAKKPGCLLAAQNSPPHSDRLPQQSSGAPPNSGGSAPPAVGSPTAIIHPLSIPIPTVTTATVEMPEPPPPSPPATMRPLPSVSDQPPAPPRLMCPSAPTPPLNPTKREEEWKCPKCSNVNGKNTLKCFVCRTTHPNSESNGTKMKKNPDGGEVLHRAVCPSWECNHCVNNLHTPSSESKAKIMAKKAGKFIAKTTAISAVATLAVLGGTALALPAIGFTAAGITAGSIATFLQSTFCGGTIAAGSVFSVMQSAGAVGLATSTQIGVGVASTATTVVVEAVRKTLKK